MNGFEIIYPIDSAIADVMTGHFPVLERLAYKGDGTIAGYRPTGTGPELTFVSREAPAERKSEFFQVAGSYFNHRSLETVSA